MYLVYLFAGILLTAVVYMIYPIIRLLINNGKFERRTAQKIALWNSIIVGTIFCIATIELSEGAATWSGGAALLYYWINRTLLTDKSQKSTTIPGYSRPGAINYSMPPQFSDSNDISKESGNNNMSSNDLSLQKDSPIKFAPVHQNTTANIENNHSINKNNKQTYYCRICGARLFDDAVFCDQCGTKVLKRSDTVRHDHPNKHPSPTIVGRGYTCPICNMSNDVLIPCERCGYVPVIK